MTIEKPTKAPRIGQALPSALLGLALCSCALSNPQGTKNEPVAWAGALDFLPADRRDAGPAEWLGTDGHTHPGRWKNEYSGHSLAGTRVWLGTSASAPQLYFKMTTAEGRRALVLQPRTCKPADDTPPSERRD